MALDDKSESFLSLSTVHREYFIATVVLYVGNIALGSAVNGYSQTTVYFAAQYNKEVADMSFVTSVALISYLIGAMLVSFIYKVIKRQLGIALFMFVIGISLALSTECPDLMTFYALTFVSCICMGAYDASQVVWIMEMWQSKCGPYIQALYFFSSIGALIPGFLMAPFLKIWETEDNDVMWIPYTALGAFAIFAASIQLFLFFFKPYVAPPPEEFHNVDEDGNHSKCWCINGPAETDLDLWPKYLKVKLVTLSAIFFAFALAMEMSSTGFISLFGQFGAHELDQSKGSWLYTVVVGSYVIGRGLGIFVIMKIPPLFMLSFNFLTLIVANTFLLISNSGLWALWLGASLLGVGYSTVQASFSAFIERHLTFTNAIGSLMFVSGSSLGAIYPIIIGQQIQANNFILTYANFFSLGVLAITFAFILRITCTKQPGKL